MNDEARRGSPAFGGYPQRPRPPPTEPGLDHYQVYLPDRNRNASTPIAAKSTPTKMYTTAPLLGWGALGRSVAMDVDAKMLAALAANDAWLARAAGPPTRSPPCVIEGKDGTLGRDDKECEETLEVPARVLMRDFSPALLSSALNSLITWLMRSGSSTCF